jgi:hypothetical protein
MTNTKRKPWYRPRNIALGFLALCLIGIAWAGYWVYWALTVEPNPSTDYAAQLEQLSRDAQPPGENGWPDILRAIDIFHRLDEGIPASDRSPLHASAFEFGIICDATFVVPEHVYFTNQNVTPESMREEAVAALDYLEAEGAWQALAEAGAAPNIVKLFPSGNWMLLYVDFSENTQLRAIARARAASLQLALESNDTTAAVQAITDLHTLSRASMNQPFVIGALVGLAIDALKRDILFHAANTGMLREDLASQLLDLHRTLTPPPDLNFHIEGERIMLLDTFQHFFSDDGNGDGILLSQRLDQTGLNMGGALQGAPNIIARLGNLQGLFLASRKETTAKANEYLNEVIAMSKLPASERWQREETFDATMTMELRNYRFMFLGILMPALSISTRTHDFTMMKHEATTIALAIAIYRARHGSPPATIEALVPDIMPELPIDPMCDRPFGYRVIENDDFKRDYLLYSFGRDGEDNDGKEVPFAEPTDAFTGKHYQGADYIINRPPVEPNPLITAPAE